MESPADETPSRSVSPSRSRSTAAESDSESASPSHVVSLIGRPRDNPVWDYFTYDAQSNKSLCQVESESGKICGHAVSGKYTTNIKSHLRKAHLSEFDEVVLKEAKIKVTKQAKKAAKSKRGAGYQLTLGESLESRPQYDKGSDRYKAITKRVAIFIGATNMPNSLVENPEFKALLSACDPRYHVPGRGAISKEIDVILAEVKGKIQDSLSSANKINLCADIWTKRGMSSSYLGVSAHFFSRKDHKRQVATLAVRRMTGEHTGDNIRALVEEILKEWDIPTAKIGVIMTDSGSNMVKAFRQSLDSMEEGEDEEEDETGFGDFEQDFDSKEVDHDITFRFFAKRISCFAHTIQLIVQKFNEDTTYKETLKRAYALVKRINKSTKATELLISRCGKKLLSNCPTRWSSTFLLLERLLVVKEPLTAVLNELEWDNLATSEWKAIDSICRLLQPFAQYTTLGSGEEYTTVSGVLPIIMELNLHLEEQKCISELSGLASQLQSDLKRRFKKYTDPGDLDHESLFLVATMLDPRYKVLLNRTQAESAKANILKLLNQNEDESSSSSAASSPIHQDLVEKDCEPPKKRFCHLTKILEARLKEGSNKIKKSPLGELELAQYLQVTTSISVDMDPLEYWTSESKTYPLLSSLSFDILSIPASSAPIERVFSTAGESTSGKRNRLADRNLEREILLRKNKDYLYTN